MLKTLGPASAHSLRINEFPWWVRHHKAALLKALESPRLAQALVLADLNSLTQDAAFWKDRTGPLRSTADLASSVPIRDYESFASAIERESLTKGGTLSCSPVLRWLKTSGTSGRAKQIPYTQHWLRRYRVPAMYAMWDTYLSHAPEILAHQRATLDMQSTREFAREAIHGVAHQAISNRHPRVDSIDWYPPWFDAPWYAPEVSVDHRTRLYARLRYFIGQDLRAITSINPSMVLALVDELRASAELLLRDLAEGTFRGQPSTEIADPRRARELDRVLSADHWSLNAVWPRLGFVSCWTTAGAAQYLEALREAIPNAKLVPFMTCGTEGVVTVPVDDEIFSQPLAVNQAVFEFIPADADPASWLGTCAPTLQPHELQEGATYHIVMSQGNGLLRLWTKDLFEVTRMSRGLPWLRFVERFGVYHSFTGEKLTYADISSAFASTFQILRESEKPYLIGPEWRQPHPRYVVVVEGRQDEADLEFGAELDRQLCAINVEYASKRASERLLPLVVRRCPPDAIRERFESRRASQTSSQLKFLAYEKDSGFFHAI